MPVFDALLCKEQASVYNDEWEVWKKTDTVADGSSLGVMNILQQAGEAPYPLYPFLSVEIRLTSLPTGIAGVFISSGQQMFWFAMLPLTKQWLHMCSFVCLLSPSLLM